MVSKPPSFLFPTPPRRLPPETPAPPPPYSFDAERADCVEDVDRGLGAMFVFWAGGGHPPARLLSAMRHGISGGKRLRPLLLRQSARVFNVTPLRSLAAQLAVEMVHCYSLIHDDLPAMDDDDLRRGLQSVHKAFDEATAILAGDALLALAFSWLADSGNADPGIRARLVVELATAAGAAGMVGGQMRDIEGETETFSLEDIDRMQSMKTGALICASVRMGAILGGADEEGLAAMTAYGEHAGRAFQLADDILDVTATTETLGKAAGKDAAAGKQTVVGHIGVDAARRYLGDLTHAAITALTKFGPEADGLRATAQYFATRES